MSTHKPDGCKPRAINLFSLPCGGFEVRDPWVGRDDRDELMSQRGDIHFSPARAAFSTLDEALTWLRENMAQPVNE